MADTLVSLVWLMRKQGRFADAARIADRPLAIYSRGRSGPIIPSLCVGCCPLRPFTRSAPNSAKLSRLFRRALEIRRKAFGPDHINVADSYLDLARLAAVQRDFEVAAAYMAQLLKGPSRRSFSSGRWPYRAGADQP